VEKDDYLIYPYQLTFRELKKCIKLKKRIIYYYFVRCVIAVEKWNMRNRL
jgi:hypothetical protein